ncbi:MAG: NADH-quinone oxidoreductase subunit C [Chloroflexi bacterium]|nr:NADH-quinone oxidoreductase subunit C [Chloroflexota bacterium]
MAFILVPAEWLIEICHFLRNTPGLEFDYLVSVTGVDYLDYFEVIYNLHSIGLNQAIALKVRVERDKPVVPSVSSIWWGADFQEREVYDLLGIEFSGHPNLKRILLWEGYPGHPLRKDFGMHAEEMPASIPEGLPPRASR